MLVCFLLMCDLCVHLLHFVVDLLGAEVSYASLVCVVHLSCGLIGFVLHLHSDCFVGISERHSVEH